MSSFICYLGSDQIFLATDTLATAPGGEPLFLASKASYVPHLKTIIAGTGIAGFSNEWARRVERSGVVTGIENLDHHTPERLRQMWQQCQEEHELPSDVTTTVYQFGLSEVDGSPCGYAYRSAEEFVSNELQFGWYFKPACDIPSDEDDLSGIIEAMMREQRASQMKLPEHEQVFIGGECIAMHLTAKGCAIYSVFRFEDYAETLHEILTNYNAG